MRRACLILMLVALLLGGGTEIVLAGHGLNSPVATTNPGDFWVSGNMDLDGTGVFDGVCTFNANAIFTLDVSIGGDLTVGAGIECASLLCSADITATGDVICDSLCAGSNLTVADDITLSGDLNGARVWVNMGISSSDQTGGLNFRGAGNYGLGVTAGIPVTTAGSVRGYAVQYHIDSFSAGAYAVTRFYIDGAKTFADSFYVTGTGYQKRTGTFPRGTHTFVAGDHLFTRFDIGGTIQYDKPFVTWDLQLDD